MGHEGDLFACPLAMGKLVNAINTKKKIQKLASQPVTSPFSDIYYYSLLFSFRKSLTMDLPRHSTFGAKTR